MTQRRGLLGAGAIYAIANFASAGVPFLLLPILTRVLDRSQYGQITNFLLVSSACTTMAGLTLHAAVGMRWFARDQIDFPRFVASTLMVSIVSTIVVALVGALIAMCFDLNFGLSPVWIALAAVSAGCTSLTYTRAVLWQSQQSPYLAAALQFANSLLNAVLSVFAVVVLNLGAEGRMGGILVSGVTLASISVLLLYRLGDARGTPKREYVLSSLRFGLPLIPHAFASVVVATADRFFISKQLGTVSLGVYGAAAQLGLVMPVVADAFSKAYSPWLYERMAKGSAQDLKAVVGAIYLVVPVFCVLAAGVAVFVYIAGSLMLGPQFHSALSLLGWFVLGGAFIGMYYSVAGLFFATGKTELISTTTGAGAVAGLMVSFYMVKRFGMTGGAISYALTQMLVYVFTFSLAVRLHPLPWKSARECMRSAFLSLR